MTENSQTDDRRSVTMSKERGKKWVVEFIGRITRRELNHLRRLLPVEYARMARKKQRLRIQAEREARLKLESLSKTTSSANIPFIPPVKLITEEPDDATAI